MTTILNRWRNRIEDWALEEIKELVLLDVKFGIML